MNPFRNRRALLIVAASVALGASLAAAPASANQISVGQIQRSFAQPCKEIAQTKAQFAHRIGVDLNNKEVNIRRLGPCKLSYYGPVVPDFKVGKDEIVCTLGTCVGYGQRFNLSNELTIQWLPSLRGLFAVNCQLNVPFYQMEEYIRHQGDASYWAGQFWDGGDSNPYQKILYYTGPKRPFVVPIDKLVQLPDGRIFSPCYYFRGGKVVAEGGMYGVTRVRDFAKFGRLYSS